MRSQPEHKARVRRGRDINRSSTDGLNATLAGRSAGHYRSGDGLIGGLTFGGIHYHGEHVHAGIYNGSHGLTAYYYRDRHHHHQRVFHYGEFYGGEYYPYGYFSSCDVYYYRYPYHYVRTYDYYPTWTVYVEPPETVYVASPVQTVYVGQAGGTATSSDVAGDAGAPDTANETNGRIEVEPQQRIPVNNTLLADGQRLFREGKYEKARSLFVQSVLNDPENGFAQLAYGLGHFAVGDYQSAARAVRRGLALAPDVVDQPIDVTRQYGKTDDFDQQLEALKHHLEARPDHEDGWFLLGYLDYSSGRSVEALRAFEKASTLDPQDTYAAVLYDSVRRVTIIP